MKPQHGTLVFGIQVAGQLRAFHFQHHQPFHALAALQGEDEIRINSSASPTLDSVLLAGDVAMPPGQRGFTVEIDRDVALVLTGKVAFVDRGEQAFFERSAGFADQLFGAFGFVGLGLERHVPVLPVGS